jgi:2-C-methyl-D-erythritol 4-phosphate cytidylyltransferase
MTVTALIVAAGRGVRLGALRPKAYVTIAGETILARAVAAFATHPNVGKVVVVAGDPDEARQALLRVAPDAQVVRGGAERQDSVRLGLEAVPDEGLVLVHDAARPLIEAALIDAVIEAAREHGAAIPVVHVSDTVKRLGADGTVAATVPREGLGLAQTPQGFRVDILRGAYEAALRDRFLGTDDASLVERLGRRVSTVPGSERNIKITVALDLAIAEVLLRAYPGERRGHGP